MSTTTKKKAIIIGAGPAGLTAGYELLQKTDIIPIIYEATGDIGGIAKTHNFKGNRMDMGGHRFFSKSERIMNWWLSVFKLQGQPSRDDKILNTSKPFSTETGAPDPEKTDDVILLRNRLSRIFYLRNFFDYPVSLNMQTISNLGLIRLIKIAFSYFAVRLFPRKNEKSLEDFIINRFGKELYETFFKDYTEKVWGIPPSQIKPDWGAQRIKGLSITRVLLHALKNIFGKKESSLSQKKTETSLIEQFIYPKLGPGQLWEEVARKIEEKGGKIYFNHKVTGITLENNKVTGVKITGSKEGFVREEKGDYFFSTMPVKDLINSMEKKVPEEVKTVSEGLLYRDFITVGLLLDKMKIRNRTKINTINDIIPDLWIYIQERDVKIGRLQVFNNWSPYLIKDPSKVWVGLEYFANEGDDLWEMEQDDFTSFAIDELEKIQIIDKSAVLDSCVVKVPKAYPAYFGSYDNFDTIIEFTNSIDNLFLIGRNGMHRYNNMDHSMLTAMCAVDSLLDGSIKKESIWTINTEEDYHEKK